MKIKRDLELIDLKAEDYKRRSWLKILKSSFVRPHGLGAS